MNGDFCSTRIDLLPGIPAAPTQNPTHDTSVKPGSPPSRWMTAQAFACALEISRDPVPPGLRLGWKE
jgi:hypothetical protein